MRARSDYRSLALRRSSPGPFEFRASDAVKVAELNAALDQAKGPACDRLIAAYAEIEHVTASAASPSAARETVVRTLSEEPNWKNRPVRFFASRRHSMKDTDLWTFDVATEDSDPPRKVRGRGNTENDAKQEALTILENLGWKEDFRRVEGYSVRPMWHVPCVVVSKDDDDSVIGHGPTCATARDEALKVASAKRDWTGKELTLCINVSSGTVNCTLAVDHEGMRTIVSHGGDTDAEARNGAIEILKELGWSGSPSELSPDYMRQDEMGQAATTEETSNVAKTVRQTAEVSAVGVGFLVFLALSVFDLVGIVHAFGRHGATEGFLALLIPPYGMYMGIEAFAH